MMKKKLIVVVEGTCAMGPFWKTIISDYLEKMIRSFAEADSIEQNPSTGDVELSLVVFNVHDSYSACMLQKSGWTRDIDLFFQWLSTLPFSGGGFNDVAAAEGLAEALMMFSSLKNADGQRQCILVAASNPFPFTEASLLSCSVSLSVICPRKLPKLRAIYNAGKCDQQAAAPPVDTSKNPNFLVLISKNFSEACAAFSHTEMESLAPNQTLVEMDMSSVPPVSGPAATSNPSVRNQQPISAGYIPLGRNNSAEANMSLSQQQTLATVPSAPSGYVKFWEGNLCMVRGGQPEHISKLQGYKKSSASESPAANLPQTLQIQGFMPKDHIVRQCTGKADILAFWAIDGHEVLNDLQERNLSAVIELPSETLFIYVADRSFRLIGLLLSNENMRFRSTIPNQQLQAQPPPGVQQLQHNQ
ncbi:hypothetical protein R3W88_013709 [Solanum pinnatisectum]|uniref:Mediator of RNA polymerase II transcription subunit 25 n=1 Tax=Solanum pinnatisectum TaxID=50273 RepID=A0AAV9KQ08_9SOLN|nr:hypothetical protein R3W88_013709 [Solanum pinnatisectum]